MAGHELTAEQALHPSAAVTEKVRLEVRTPAIDRSGGGDFEFDVGQVLFRCYDLFLQPVFGKIGLNIVSVVHFYPT